MFFHYMGPCLADQKVCIESKGCLPKDLKNDLAVITLTGTETNWHHEIRNVETKSEIISSFTIPPYPYLWQYACQK